MLTDWIAPKGGGGKDPVAHSPHCPVDWQVFKEKMHLVGGFTKILLCLNILQVFCHGNETYRGCAFEQLPELQSREPESIPLHIEVDILITGLRGGSGSGDFFRVDAE